MNGHSRNDWTDGLEKTLFVAINGIAGKAPLPSLALLAASVGCIRDDEQLATAYATAIAKKAKLPGVAAANDPIIKTAVFTLVGGVPAYVTNKLGIDSKRLRGLKMLKEHPEYKAITTALCEATDPATVRALAKLVEKTAIERSGIGHVYTALVGATRRLQIKDADILADVVRAAVSLQPNNLDDVAAKFSKDPKDLLSIVKELQETALETPDMELARVA